MKKPAAILNLVSAITAFCGLAYELTLAQALSATLGGTVLRYCTTIGLFTCSLGIGAWVYERVRWRYSRLKFFATLQFLMAALGLAAPWLVVAADPSESAAPAWFLEGVSYVPIVLVALVSGFELPLLMEVGRRLKSDSLRVLASDYFGMFAGSLAFPLFLLPEFGLFWTSGILAILNLLAGALVLPLIGSAEDKVELAGGESALTQNESAPAVSSFQYSLASLLVLGTSFCSMCYELLIAKALTDLTNDEILSQSVTIGVYLLGLGLGAYRVSRSASPSSSSASALKKLLNVEITLTSLGALSVIAMWSAATTFELIRLPSGWGFFILQPFALLIGILSGYELPLLLRSAPFSHRPSHGWPLALNYFGGLLGGFAVPILLLPRFGLMKSVVAVALINFICCLALVRPAGFSFLSRRIGYLLPGIVSLVVAIHFGPAIEQVFLKTHYMGLRLSSFSTESIQALPGVWSALGHVRRIETHYQNIDIVDSGVTRNAGLDEDYSVYLNRQPQFSQSTWRTYHESFAHGAINLAGQLPERVLILGGGDGLLAGQLLKHKEIKSIELVELDPAMIDLANKDLSILALNAGALKDPRVSVVVDDAFRFIRSTSKTFDAIYIDFPYPVSYDLTRLFSFELYQAVRAKLNPNGFIVMDAPIWRSLDRADDGKVKPHEIIMSTLSAAGFQTIFAFGPYDPLIFAQSESRSVKFDYGSLPPFVSNAAFVNLTDLNHIVGDANTSADKVNSVFRPQRFR